MRHGSPALGGFSRHNPVALQILRELLDRFPFASEIIFVEARCLKTCGSAVIFVVTLSIPNPIVRDRIIDDSKSFPGQQDGFAFVVNDAIGFVIDSNDNVLPSGREGPEFVASR